ncbi:G-protein-signaling modulator 2-like isoform X2 [Pollicipes pollicipes]|uniref:G-protein-signaling modulator 2-like isoform X2 n=1 Tax=Pollicipes pollicipes TaxID=41117 RepID=UPI0018853BFB|nr:G-protein-signaling modulator 2-like isoform X2 [Pollicipes pollicipes]
MVEKMDGSSCMELALEGERLCKAGDCRAGVAFFEAAIQAGTDDLKTLTAIYSQLGNAYFYLGEYIKAMQYHKHDLTLARTMQDKMGEAKASGNLGNTMKVLGRYDESLLCCKRHLSVSRELGDKVGEGRALYNLANVYHSKGKHLGRSGNQDPGHFPDAVKECLQKAVEYYNENLQLMVELGDRSAQGRACGNLGNTHYLLGNFTLAISYHQQRLKIAKEFGDKAAERRAHSNLGNAHVFLGQFETAAEHYKRTLVLAQDLGDRAMEAQACYSLGNTYTLLWDYATAIEYHMRHMRIAQELCDTVGEGRACWSLGNAHTAVGNNDKALYYAQRHLHISQEIGDMTGLETARMNLSELRRSMGRPAADAAELSDAALQPAHRTRRPSMDNMDLLKMTPDAKRALQGDWDADKQLNSSQTSNDESYMDGDDFFEQLTRFQSKRMDDQRCSLTVGGGANGGSSSGSTPDPVKDDLIDLIAGMQSRRMDEQRADLPAGELELPGFSGSKDFIQRLSVASDADGLPDDQFFDMLIRCQGSRLDDQRSVLPELAVPHPPSAPTVPDEDFFSLILRLQSERIEDQRSTLPPSKTLND